MEVLKVSTKSNPNSVAGALAAIIKEKKHCRNTSSRCRCNKPSCESNSNSKRLRGT